MPGPYVIPPQEETGKEARTPALAPGMNPQPHGAKDSYAPGLPPLRRMAESLCQALDAKDRQTWLHSEQVGDLAYALAIEAGIASPEAEMIRLAGQLHDIGKIGVPDHILQKPGKLSRKEMKIMRGHPAAGARIVAPLQGLADETGLGDIILHHHERWDGRGYPHGLKEKAIPLGSRILAVADAFSAMVQDRPYRKGVNCHEALSELQRVAGKQLDPELAAAFEACASRLMLVQSHQFPVYRLSGVSGGSPADALVFLPFGGESWITP